MVVTSLTVPNNSTISVTTISRYAGGGNLGTALYSYAGVANIGFQAWGRARDTDPWTLLVTGSGPSGFITFPLTPFLGFTLGTPDAGAAVSVTFYETAQCCC
jgi:hypothetical protein